VAVGTTPTVTLARLLVPPGPLQVIEYTRLAVRPPVLCVPLAGNVPLQPPEAVHDAAFVELQVSCDALPGVTAIGLAVRIAVGVTSTVALAMLLVPPGPVQVSE
jgi:hypothetical protein